MGLCYTYDYSLWADERIVSKYCSIVLDKAFVFETDTVFILKKLDGEEENLGSEKYDSVLCGTQDDNPDRKTALIELANLRVSYRLRDYGIYDNDVYKFNCEAIEFAMLTEADPKRADQLVVPIRVDFKIVTVQRQGETIEEARERAVVPDVLVPLDVYPFPSHTKGPSFDRHRSFFLTRTLPRVRVRVKDVNKEGLMIERCSICSRRLLNIGTQITRLPGCEDVFHSHCIIKWLWNNDDCPICRSVAYRAITVFANQ